MSISDWCQIVTAATASISFISSAAIRYRNNVFAVANLVSTWLEDNDSKLLISNQSNTSLYNVFVFSDLNVFEGCLLEHLDRIQEFSCPHFYYETFPAHKILVNDFQQNNAAGGQHLIPAMLFTDTNGHYWYRKPSGKLVHLHSSYMNELVKRAYVLGHVKA